MPEVKIYSTPHCPYCKIAKNYFEKHGIAFSEINVEGNESAQKELFEKSDGMEVPVFEIGNTVIRGFKKGQIDKLLNLNQKI